MTSAKALTGYYVIGEASGDVLAADLHDCLMERLGGYKAVGLAGEKLAERGVNSLFDIEDIAVMGFSAVLKRLPLILKRINQVVSDIKNRNPDFVVLVDSPDFTHRVAKKLRKAGMKVPVIGYVCPSIWAWRSSRGTAMAEYIDHVLAILPFEPDLLESLNGPPATYVGHPATSKGLPDPDLHRDVGSPPRLILLPGSRKGEISRLVPIFKRVVEIMSERNPELEFVLPAAPGRHDFIRELISDWARKPEIVRGEAAKVSAFETADAALAASGTVTLELALYKVPMVATYVLDPIAKRMRPYLDVWTASLPNVIADRVVIQEQFDEYAKPGNIARQLERLLADTPERQAQMEGYAIIRERLSVEQPAGVTGANAIADLLEQRGLL